MPGADASQKVGQDTAYAQTRPGDGLARPIIVHESPTHIVVAIEIPRDLLRQWHRFLESLLVAAVEE